MAGETASIQALKGNGPQGKNKVKVKLELSLKTEE